VDEPYWAAFSQLVDWASHNTISTLWSCLAAHAAVLRLDRIERVPLREKCIGIFDCDKLADHPARREPAAATSDPPLALE
jgi:homoserine O-succinyltransferase